MNNASYRVAFDIGGTFTDFALLHEATGTLTIHKRLTTAADPAEGVAIGLAELFEHAGVSASQVTNAIHGTTLVTNALIERSGAKVALITTKGFRDLLHIGNEQRYDIYDLMLRLPEPLVPRYLRLGIDERVDRLGRVLQPVTREAMERAIDHLRTEDARDRTAPSELGDLFCRDEITSLAICFLHAYRQPANEQAAGRFARELWPAVDVSLSSEVAPEIREYERASTTVANAYVKPVARRYLERIATILRDLGYPGRLYLMLSSGGICTLETAAAYPIHLIESGPAGGSIGAAFFGQLCGLRDLVSFDMGGTTAKISVIEDGRPTTVHQIEAARIERFKKGSGLPLQVASVELMEIGAGGGSIAWIDELGLLKVGPRSAGSSPGPACYDQGGDDPTVTDADLILGYLDAESFLGGSMRLNRDAAERAIDAKIARPLGLSLTEAAWGIHQLVNENMAAAARIHIIERGHDPRRYALLAFGGAGPIHAAGVARILGQRRVVYPQAPGVLSAVGFLAAPAAFEFAQSRPQLLHAIDWDATNAMLLDLEKRARDLLLQAGVAAEQITIERTADARFAGQLQEISFPLPDGPLGSDQEEAISSRFNRVYADLYGHLHDEVPIELLTWRVVARGQLAEVRIRNLPTSPEPTSPQVEAVRPVYWPEANGFIPTPVFTRSGLTPGMTLVGPAIVEERESTLLVPPGAVGAVDGYLTLSVERRVDDADSGATRSLEPTGAHP
jgi:N-methylhydantoinase A/oxoprolinase/acetone carboxylase beta subunit